MRRLLLIAALAALLPATAFATPQINFAMSGPAGDNGWFVGPVTVKWFVSGEISTSGCETRTLTADTRGTTITCTATDAANGTAQQPVTVAIDQTPPTNLSASPARPPDASPFYTAPVAITWSANDATSGVAACTATTYSGPDTPSAAPQGGCRDRAGNLTAPLAATFAYDATAPALTNVAATPRADGTVALSWGSDSDGLTVSVTRQPGGATLLDAAPAATTHGLTDGPLPAATTYTYTIALRDAAGHVTTAAPQATTPAAVRASAAQAGTRTLRWTRRPGARYYNFQLYRNGHKLLSAWPTSNHYTLHKRWRYQGRTHKLQPGRYRWYVWPGYGPRSAHRYGRLHAKGTVAPA